MLLVGDVSARLELELASCGLECAVAQNANDAVARMKTTRFPYVVVPPTLADMGGVDFIHGVLRHFDASVVLYGNGVEPGEVNALLRTGRVAHFPAHAEGHVVADFLARRAGTPQPSVPQQTQQQPTPTPRPTAPPPLSGPIPGAAPAFNLTPGAATLFGGAGGSLSNVATSFPPAAAPTPAASAGFVTTPSGGFAAFNPQGGFPNVTPSGGVPRPPTLGATPGVAQQGQGPQFEQVVDELARTNSEVVMLRGKLAAAEQEKATLSVEVEAARRSAIADVAQVMALSDEGDPIAEEIEELKNKVSTAENDRELARAEVDALRAERDRLVAEAAQKAGVLAELQAQAGGADVALNEAKAEAARLAQELAQKTAEADAAKKELEDEGKALEEMEAALLAAQKARADAEAQALAQAGDAVSAVEKEKAEAVDAAEKLKAEAVDAVEKRSAEALEAANKEKAEAVAAIEQQRAALEERVNLLEAQRVELVSAVEKGAQDASAHSDVEAALRIEAEKLKTDVASARTDATTVRLDLQEALMRLDEATTSLAAATQERDALRAEAGPLREWANKVVAEHARTVEETEKLRSQAEAADARQNTIHELQTRIEQLQVERDKAAASGGARADGDVEVLLARSRQLADLVRALEPFMWGLTQATGFYTKAAVEGGDAHLKLLQQLQGVLLRLRDEIAMLDLS